MDENNQKMHHDSFLRHRPKTKHRISENEMIFFVLLFFYAKPNESILYFAINQDEKNKLKTD